MSFLSLVVVLALVQLWGSGGFIQKDRWYTNWLEWLTLRMSGGLLIFSMITAPVFVLLLVIFLLQLKLSAAWLFFINIPVLLYSLGRGDFIQSLHDYIEASRASESVKAALVLDSVNADPHFRQKYKENDWVGLNAEALRLFVYKGFERMFAVLFCFICLGAAGALIYRLSVLCRQYLLQNNREESGLVAKWIYLLEWPAARLLSLTWAVVGNFDFCMMRCRSGFVNLQQTTADFLSCAMRGALGDFVEGSAEKVSMEGTQTIRIEPRYSLKLVEAAQAMFSRSLLLWVFAFAVLTLLI